MENKPIIVERLFNANVAKVCKALTDKNEMKEWYFDPDDFRAEPGFKFKFTGGPSPEKRYVHLCQITEVILLKKLTYSWRYEGFEGNSFVTFELFEKGNQTLLKLTHIGIETFPSSNPDFTVEDFVAGWNEIINVSLKKQVE